MRRTIALGFSVLSRTTERVVEEIIPDERNTPQRLPESAALGEERFVEAGTTVRMTLGARRFSTLLELYGRRTHFANVYLDELLPVETVDTRGGGRFTVDAWIGSRVRLFASYDVSSALATAPEITGYKSLRLTLTTSDTPHLGFTPDQLQNLAGGVYQVQRNAGAASYVEIPTAPADAFTRACSICVASG